MAEATFLVRSCMSIFFDSTVALLGETPRLLLEESDDWPGQTRDKMGVFRQLSALRAPSLCGFHVR